MLSDTFGKPEKVKLEEWVGIIGFMIILFLTMDAKISMVLGMIIVGVSHLILVKNGKKEI